MWLTDNIAYDAAAFLSGRRAVTDPEGVFRTRMSVCQGYAELFRELGLRLGLEVRVVSGYSKGYGYRAGESFQRTNHAWNAIWVDGGWHLFDATWGAGFVDGRRFVREYGEFWFDPRPELFVRTHLPEDSAWQLVGNPIDMDQYLRQPFVASYVYENLCESGFSDDQQMRMLPALSQPGFNTHALGSLGKLGFSHEEVAIAVWSGTGIPVAYAYDDHDVTVIRAPVARVLRAGELITVEIDAPTATQGALINNGRWIYLEREGSLLSGSVTPVAGTLSVNLRLNHDRRTSYWQVLEYEVQ